MPIDVGTPAPDFLLKDQNNQEVRLSDFRGRKAVLLVFYPLAFSRRCHGELTEIQENLPEYTGDHLQVLTISVDSVYSHKVWADQEGFDFPLLADFWPHGEVAAAYGVFDTGRGYANRGTFLIDTEGVIAWSEMNGPGEARDQKAWRTALATLPS
jgi:peroxiredoxin